MTRAVPHAGRRRRRPSPPTPGGGRRRRCRARGSAPPPGRSACHAVGRVADVTPSSVPDVLAPGLRCVFCGINPGRVSAAAAAHFANPRNDFWRLLHDAGFTPRLLRPAGAVRAARARLGVTNAAYRTTPGSGDLRRGDFDRPRGSSAWRASCEPLRDRVRRQGGLPRALQRAARARPAAAHARRDGALRAAVDVAGERRRARTPSGCAGSARCAGGSSRRRARRCARWSSTRTSASCSSGSQNPVTRRDAGGRRRAAASRQGRRDEEALRRELLEEVGPRRRSSSGRCVWEREPCSPWSGGCSGSASASTSSASTAHEPRRRSTSFPRASPATAGGRSRSSPTTGRAHRPRERSGPSCGDLLQDGRRRSALDVSVLSLAADRGGDSSIVAPARGQRSGSAARPRSSSSACPRSAILEGEPRGRAMKELGLRWRPLGYGASSSPRSRASCSPRTTGAGPPPFKIVLCGEGGAVRRARRRPRTCTTSSTARASRPRSARAASSATRPTLVVVGWISYSLT